ncbi:MAG: hypothetical protein ACFFGP_03370 [Promethearchaeota archaeon]
MNLKNSRKKSIKTILLISLFLIFSFTPISQYLIPIGGANDKTHDDKILCLSAKNNLCIHIDNNWTETATTYDWCSGSGSWNDPFTIEDVEILANSTVAAIFINNSLNEYFIIKDCMISNNSTETFSAGIRLENTNNGKIKESSSFNNSIGILFINANNITIEESEISFNNHGICVWQSSSDNIIHDNDILNNSLEGINITNSDDNIIYYNDFLNNTVHAIDSGNSNLWDIGSQGNFWDDYLGKDADDDGIGDSSYAISGSAGSQDNYPIWWDAPIITVYSPIPYSLYGSSPLNFSVSTEEGVAYKWWYTIDSDPTKNLFSTNGTVNAFVWSLLANGSHTIFFYVNDSNGYEDYNAIIIYKDVETPSIDIIYPETHTIFGNKTCSFTIVILESNLNSTWYTVNNGTSIFFNGISGQNHGNISESEWELQTNGTIFINFFANDTMGNLGKNNITVYKDIIPPTIQINKPTQHEIFGNTPPECNVTFVDRNGVNTTLYYLTDGITTTPTKEWTGAIYPADWDLMSNGTVTIFFYVNDTVGNVRIANLSIYKDIIPPNILINNPQPYDLFSVIPPVCDVSFYDINGVNSSWYQLTNGTFTTISQIWTGTIDINNWNMMKNGTVTIIFFANDSIGNINSESVIVYKDIISPYITINEPKSNDIFGSNPPECNLTLYDINNIDYVWYKLTDGIITTNVREWTGTINFDDWSALSNGSVTIIFYANDTLGNIANANVSVYKDIIAPIISIINPNPYEVFGAFQPECNILFEDINGVDAKWYQLTDGITTTDIREWTGTIHIDDWNIMTNGTVNLIFYANDTLGNIATTNVSVYKDIIAPIITIINPNPYEVFGASRPECNVTFEDINGVDLKWYQLTDGTITTSVQEWTGIILYSDWNSMANGTITIIFYANDTLGNIATTNVSVYKDIISPSVIINEPNSYELYGQDPPDCNLTLYDINSIDNVWYELTDGITTTYIRDWTGIINFDDWNTMANGTVIIVFYANDTLGNIATTNVSVYKDIISPSITINKPNLHELFGYTPPGCGLTLYDRNSIDYIWYELTDGSTITSAREWTGTINFDDWNAMSNGTVTITFYANDTVGNVGIASVSIYKDIVAPNIFIYEPYQYDLFGVVAPICNVTFYDINGINASWYQLTNGTLTTASRTWSGSIDINDWNMMKNGTVTIIFFANDSVGNMNFDNIFLYKDIESPDLIINEPLSFQVFGYNPPGCDLTLYDRNSIDYIWYELTDGSTTTSAREWTGTINFDDWNAMANGTVTIIFYANDTVGNVGIASVSIYKDIFGPEINIIEPLPNQIFGLTPPICIVMISDINGVNETWYQLTDGITTTNTRIWTGAIHVDDWMAMSNGSVTIIFYANDTVGNIGTASVSIYKDIIGPDINIISPTPHSVFGKSVPNCIVNFYDINGVNTTWYQLTNGIITTTLREWNSFIYSNDWNAMPNGTVFIVFFANDTLGNMFSVNVSIYKDSLSPIIIIHDPEDWKLYGITVPVINVSVIDDHLESVWYQLDNGSVITPYREFFGFIYQEDWDLIGNGTVIIRFIAYDSVNNLASATLILRKNIFDPVIIILDPNNNELFGLNPPDITLYISSAEPDTIWYQLYNSTFSTSILIWDGSINLNAWQAFGNGTLFITFYINDTLGNIGFDTIMLRKDTIPPILFINAPTPFTLFGVTPPVVSITCSDENSIFSIYYQLHNVITTPLRIWTGSILLADWNTIGNGTVIIMFYAEDIVGNMAFANLTVRKDIIAPNIWITYPDINELYGHERPILYVILDDGSGISEISYQLKSDKYNSSIIDWNNPISISIVIQINQQEWNKVGNGTINIYLYVTDVIGNQGIASVMIRKDIIAPSISIQYPTQYQNVGRDSPFFQVEIIDGNLLYCWYNIIGTNVNVSFYSINGPFTGKINQTLWESIWDIVAVGDNITIRFYAQDRKKNCNYSDVYVVKYIAPEPYTPIPLPIELTDLIFLGCLGAVAITFPLIIKKSRLYSSSDKKQKNVIQRIMLLSIILLTLISVAIILT